ncbi:splicing factor 3B subunit 1-like [Dorcoceras hygrometricum]|uniref:Splicing factor 3B subunit 1-like n=1 Tax=Dorcoceras hygrometricum TaxID=472368 RepID=A0A2Z7B8X3_9LAMI|nr:splicing factor 3B subunit 1-like [Dorcoceras hygrometricum]
MENEGMVNMFKALESSRLRGLLGCSSVIYEAALVEFFQNASVRDDKVFSTVQGKSVEFTEEVFAGMFELPMEGLTNMSDVTKDLVFDARTAFSYSVTVKAGSFDAVTHERFLMMSAIHGGVKVNWGRLLFGIFKDMVTPATNQARGYAVQICILLKGAPDLELGESKDFPPLKILTAKTVGTYIAKNKNIIVEDVDDEPVAKMVKKKATTKKRSDATADEPVLKKKRTPGGRDAPAEKEMAMVPVVQDVEPLSTVLAPTPKAQRHHAPKKKLVLPTGSDDEIVEKEPDVENFVDQQRKETTADDVDKIIDQVITDSAQMETDVEEPSLTRSDDIVVEDTERSIAVNDEDDNIDGDENEIDRKMESSFTAPKQFLKEPLRSGEDVDMSGSKQPSKIIETAAAEKDKEIEPVLELTEKSNFDEESMSIEDILKQISEGMMLPSVIAVEITRIKLGLGIEIPGVNEGDWLSGPVLINKD